MNCDKVLEKGTQVKVTEVEPTDVMRGLKVGDIGEVVVAPGGGFKGMFSNEKKHKVAWAQYFKFPAVSLYLGFHQVELVD